MDTTLPLGRRIQLARIARNRRQRDVARDADLPQSIVSAIETGHRPPRDDEVRAILDALGLTRDDLDLVRA